MKEENKLPTKLIEAIREGDLEKIKELFNAGADVKGVDNSGNTCLHHAACVRNIKVFNLILEKAKDSGVDLEALNNDGLTPLDIAIKNKNIEVVEAFKKTGINSTFFRSQIEPAGIHPSENPRKEPFDLGVGSVFEKTTPDRLLNGGSPVHDETVTTNGSPSPSSSVHPGDTIGTGDVFLRSNRHLRLLTPQEETKSQVGSGVISKILEVFKSR